MLSCKANTNLCVKKGPWDDIVLYCENKEGLDETRVQISFEIVVFAFVKKEKKIS